MIPWTTLAWTQVHHGQLPLWNPYSALGMPLAFNWQSATFSLPALIGYLFPLRLVYTVQVLTTLCHRRDRRLRLGPVLRLSVVACAMAGTVFELSGPFVRLARLARGVGDVMVGLAVRAASFSSPVADTGYAMSPS